MLPIVATLSGVAFLFGVRLALRGKVSWPICLALCLLLFSGLLAVTARYADGYRPAANQDTQTMDSDAAVKSLMQGLAARALRMDGPILSSARLRNLTTARSLYRGQAVSGDPKPGHVESRWDVSATFQQAATPAKVSFVYRC
jgi:hypothetical protein